MKRLIELLARASRLAPREIAILPAAAYRLARIGRRLERRPLNEVLAAVRSIARRERGRRRSALTPREICRGVERCAWGLMPRYTCLPQALAGYVLCAERGYRVDLRLGVASPETGFRAHAWLEYEGSVILGEMVGMDELAVVRRSEELLR